MDYLFTLLAIPILGMLCSVICYLTAEKKRLNPMLWLLMGFILGPLAIPFVFLAPDNVND